MLKSLKLGSHLAVSFSSFNLGDSRLASKQNANECSQEDFDGKEVLNLYGQKRGPSLSFLTSVGQRFAHWFLSGW